MRLGVRRGFTISQSPFAFAFFFGVLAFFLGVRLRELNVLRRQSEQLELSSSLPAMLDHTVTSSSAGQVYVRFCSGALLQTVPSESTEMFSTRVGVPALLLTYG